MIRIPRPNRRSLLWTALAASCLLSACSQPPQRLEPDNLYWPLPPSPPRIHYLQSIYTENDIGRVYSFREKLFGKGYFDGLVRPYGISAKRGKLYVSDLVLRRVLVFDLVEKRMFNIGEEGGFQVPAAAAADAAGNLYVADSSGGKVAVYGPRGGYRTAFKFEGSRPVGVVVHDALRRLYVADLLGHQVIVVDLDGRRLFTIGKRGTSDGQFNLPIDIALDRQGRLYVLDSGNFRVQLFSADGEFQGKFGMVGDRPGMFANPKGIAVDSDNHIYVTDAAFSNFQIFDRQGNILLFIGEMGSWPGYLHLPGGIAIDEQDRVYIADQLNARVQVFQYLKAPGGAESP